MAVDRYTAVWISHTSISDFLKCSRAYYLKNIYRDPNTGHKIKLMTPPLALGQAVHEVVELLSLLPKDRRFNEPLMDIFARIWQKLSGKKGGFIDPKIEARYRSRGIEMISRLAKNPGPLSNLALKLKTNLPFYWLSEEDNLILCGKIDWLEYLPASDSVHIIDFKTGKAGESPKSLQLPIYFLLARNCQKRPVTKVSYWHLERNDQPTEEALPDLKEAHRRVLKIGKRIKLIRQLERFKCPQKDGCSACRPYESILRAEAELVGVNEFNQDIYIGRKSGRDDEAVLIL
ncbi:MAG TPA: PD-(D/E)XK nuclease family protein [Candidatus Bathyarchaeia archaeon]|nr:PD-(D/E)XK nuclease family protein [Candidatus Bathyarchaeia archaeon]